VQRCTSATAQLLSRWLDEREQQSFFVIALAALRETFVACLHVIDASDRPEVGTEFVIPTTEEEIPE